MSQIVTLYSDKERTDALYPRTKVSAISDDSNTPLKELMTGMVKQEEGGTEEEVVTPINADTLGGKLTANNVVFYEEEMVDEVGQVVLRNADLLENHPANYFATSEELNNIITNGTLKMDLLWTNASPSSEFAPQTINLDLSAYKFAYLTFYNDETYNALCIVGKTVDVMQSNGYNAMRKVKVTINGVIFIDCLRYMTYANNTGTKSNDWLIPNKIYGVR